jgi:hypothetical protein
LADIEKYSLESISIKIPPHKYQYWLLIEFQAIKKCSN